MGPHGAAAAGGERVAPGVKAGRGLEVLVGLHEVGRAPVAGESVGLLGLDLAARRDRIARERVEGRRGLAEMHLGCQPSARASGSGP